MNTIIQILLGEKKLKNCIAVAYLKSFKTAQERELRIVFVGKRLQIRQYRWLHFNTHPYELKAND